MQLVVVRDALAGMEMKPALAVLALRAGVPGDRERLQAALRQLDEILLKRLDAEGVLHLEVGELAVRPVGADEVLAVALEEARRHAGVVEARVVEVAEHGSVVRGGHRGAVLRPTPLRVLGGVARRAGARADE